MKLSTLASVLWAAGLIGHLLLLAVLVVRRRWRDFPVFSSFLIFESLRTLALYAASLYGKHAYFWMYWITGFADYLFQVAIIVEIAVDVLRPTGHWVREARREFILWGVVGVFVAAMVAVLMGAPQSRGLDLWDARVTVFTSLLTCGLFAAMATAADRLGLQRRSYVIALGQGLTLWALSGLVEDLLHVMFGWGREFIWLNYVVVRSHIKTARLSRLDWNCLLARLKPVSMDDISLVALDYLSPVKGQLQFGAGDLWLMVGGNEGVRCMYANAEVLIALAGYAQRWNPLESAVVAERMRRDGVALRRATLRLSLGSLAEKGNLLGTFDVQEAAAAYYLMRQRLLALYETSHAARYPTLLASV